MKKTLCFLAVIVFLSGSVVAQERVRRNNIPIPTTPKVEPTKGASATKTTSGKSIKGNIVSVMTYADKGKAPAVTKAQAADMIKQGELLGVLSGKKLYLVVNSDGTSAASKLANGGSVTITGKIMNKGGMNMITANSVQ